jgi:hypothetical protein
MTHFIKSWLIDWAVSQIKFFTLAFNVSFFRGDLYQSWERGMEVRRTSSLPLYPWISTNHKYRLYMDVFLQPDVLKTWRFVNQTFCKPDVL